MIENYYNGLDLIEADNGGKDFIKFSPSQFEKFFSKPHEWYNEQVLGNSPAFTGSTSTHLGNIVHYFAEQVAKRNKSPNAEEIVEEYLTTITDADVDKGQIRSLWQDMSNTLIQNSVVDFKVHSTEQFIFHKLADGIYVGGSYDCLRYDYDDKLIVTDYKTAASKPSSFSYPYKLQAYIYAYILANQGYDVKAVELQYVVRPTKTLPCRHFTFSQPFDQDAYDFIESLLALTTESVQKVQSNPELTHLIFKDMRLKQ